MLHSDPYKQILEEQKHKDNFKAFEETFKARLFYEKYRVTAAIVAGASWLFNLLSIASGVLGVASLLAAFIFPDLWLMALPAFLVLGLCEAIKRTVLTNLTIGYYRDGKLNIVLLTVNLAFIAASMAATVYGGVELVRIARNEAKPELIPLKHLKSDYNKQAEEVKAKQKQLIARNTYKGKTWLSKEKELVYQKWDNDIRKLEAKKESAVAKAQKANTNKVKNYESGTNKYITVFVVLSLLIESLCVVAIVFPVYYKYRSLRDKYAIDKAKTQGENTMPLPLQPANTEKVKVHSENLKEQPKTPNTVNEKVKVHSENLKEQPRNLKVQAENVKDQVPKPKNQPLFEFGKLANLKGIEQRLMPGSVEPKGRGETQKEVPENESTEQVPSSPHKRGRGTTLDYQKIDELIKKGQLSNKEIAEQMECAESSIIKRRGKLKKLNGKVINH
ncbi:hypothetical protein [uncultured Microscilla sp.]|uniref:hypothetical protein n=1 Tax=uncultured Microscilla sp. TaxID=432653 RepID=UPI0026270BBF|nr:hypothetical protein [uncultured Microscilla sp.]